MKTQIEPSPGHERLREYHPSEENFGLSDERFKYATAAETSRPGYLAEKFRAIKAKLTEEV